MMKKYNKPEIVTLALETVDVIETSGGPRGADAAEVMGGVNANNVQVISGQISTMNNKWSW